MRYVVIIEKARRNYSAYIPDLPGWVATGATRQTVLKRIREAVTLHLAGLREDGLTPAKPKTIVDCVEA